MTIRSRSLSAGIPLCFQPVSKECSSTDLSNVVGKLVMTSRQVASIVYQVTWSRSLLSMERRKLKLFCSDTTKYAGEG